MGCVISFYSGAMLVIIGFLGFFFFVTRCKQLDSLLQERGEGICPLEAIHNQVGPVELCELEGASAVDRYTQSLGVMEAPGTLVVA